MLRELHISNLAVIEDLTLEFEAGLNAFTGQTGAGKSLVIGAFESLLGLRKATDMIRQGADEARIAGVFDIISPALAAELSGVLDQSIDAGDQLLITRKLFASGRSSVSVNGQPATAAMVRDIGPTLVDIHGQHDHQFLLKPANQLSILDAFAEADGLQSRFADTFAHLRDLRRRKSELATSASLRKQQLELYTFQAEEIDAVEPTAGEFAELTARHDVLANMQRIKGEAGHAHAALYESEGAVVERLEMITQVLAELADLDSSLVDIAQQVRESTLSMREAAFELGSYVDRLEDDPAELEEVSARLNRLNRLIQKYADRDADDPLAPVIAHRAQLATEITRLRSASQDLATINRQIAESQADLAAIGGQLHDARLAAAHRLKPLVERELADLGMPDAKLDVAIDKRELTDPHVGPSGLDMIEILVQTNPGQGFRPLRKIASGGELSRVMLAIKSILADADRISVLVFDEIDANIGGRLGSVIGRKLRHLAAAGHQVLCITHLPQIAAFGQRHFRIAKQVTGRGKARQTRTSVAVLTGKDRISELAEMMAGNEATTTTQRQARELLQAAS